jgi:hypothetical protein
VHEQGIVHAGAHSAGDLIIGARVRVYFDSPPSQPRHHILARSSKYESPARVAPHLKCFKIAGSGWRAHLVRRKAKMQFITDGNSGMRTQCA